MSRIARNPIALPKGVEISIDAQNIQVKGPLGAIARAMDPNVSVEKDGDHVKCKALGNSRHAVAMSGTMRAHIANMVTGVTSGFERKLQLVGVGYRAQAQGDKVNLSLGFSHPVVHVMPKGVKVVTPTQTEIVVSGVDRQLVGLTAAKIRDYKSPEPYKGKGVRYAGEQIRRKEGKTVQ
jgi:large subunit ribosomal protein L6